MDVTAALGRLTEFLGLGPGWDGDSADPPSRAALQNAMLFLIEQMPDGPAPSVGPGFDGSIEMEWDTSPRPSVSVTFQPDGSAYFTTFAAEEVVREFGTRDRTTLSRAVNEALG